MRGTYTAIRTALDRRRRIADVSSSPPRASIEYVGHGTVLVDLAGVKLLTDPLLRNRVTHLRRAAKVDAASLRGVDAVLISHLHYDHLDMPSLQRLGRELPVVAPRGAGALIKRKAGVTNVTEMRRRRGDPGRRRDGEGRSRRPRHRPAAVRCPRRATRVRDRGRRSLRLLRRRHGRLPGHGGARAGGRRAASDLGLGPDDGTGPHGSGSGGRGGRAARRTARDPDPLGHLLPRPPRAAWSAGFLQTPPPLFEEAMRERSPTTEVRVLQPGERTAI